MVSPVVAPIIDSALDDFSFAEFIGQLAGTDSLGDGRIIAQAKRGSSSWSPHSARFLIWPISSKTMTSATRCGVGSRLWGKFTCKSQHADTDLR